VAELVTWWRGSVGYQVYLRSFADASGDGIGDLAGLRGRLDHVARLGADYLWITPFYPSPQADHGYDVADHLGVDPIYGSLDDVRELVDGAHELGLRVVVEVVPNHTSDQHPWFLDAATSRDAERRDCYVWRDPAPDGGPPNNWVSKFGGPAWTFHPATGQYYLHHFLPEQPDLNWSDPRVRDEFDRILRFWLGLGVDGFRVDTAHLLVKDEQLRDNPSLVEAASGTDPEAVYASFDHVHDVDQPGVVDVFRRWRTITAPREAVLLGEVALHEPARLTRYVDDALDLTFYFPALKVAWDATAMRAALQPAIEVAGSSFAWPLSSHDDPRAAERFGGGRLGARRSLAYLTLLCGLPGSAVLLQGDELGLDHGGLSPAQLRDPIAVRNVGAVGRDGSRTPMPWGPGPHLGFSEVEPWLAVPAGRTVGDTVAAQERDAGSPLHRTRQLLSARRGAADLLGEAPVTWVTDGGPVVAYRRGTTLVALNTASAPVHLAVAGELELRYASAEGAEVHLGGVCIPGDSAAVAVVTEDR
jgi:alpha-glucosidase